jgi:hypothetical protein
MVLFQVSTILSVNSSNLLIKANDIISSKTSLQQRQALYIYIFPSYEKVYSLPNYSLPSIKQGRYKRA